MCPLTLVLPEDAGYHATAQALYRHGRLRSKIGMVENTLPDTYLAGRILSWDPLVTLSTTNREAPLGLMSIVPDVLGDRPALHLLHHTWTLETGDARWLSAAVARARNRYPDSTFAMLASTEIEADIYGRTGEVCILANVLCLVDERIWRPLPLTSRERFDAVYFSTLDGAKRHRLATRIARLQLIYGEAIYKEGDGYDRVRELLPQATFANHVAGGGLYRHLEPEEIVWRLSQSDVGLCLSSHDGNDEAVMHYLLCGLPVVSTRSVGGRDRYLGTAYARIVGDDPDVIAAAVQEVRSNQLDRARIRDHVGQIIAFERHNLVRALNQLVERVFGRADIFQGPSFLIGAASRVQHSGTLAKAVLSEADRQPTQLRPAAGPAPVTEPAANGRRSPEFAAVLAMARSGTNLLRSILRQAPEIDSANEAFNPATSQHLPRHFAHYLAENISKSHDFRMSEAASSQLVDGYFSFLQKDHMGTKTVLIDIKEDSLRLMDWPIIGLDAQPRLMSRMLAHNFSFIRLRRRNLLHQMASLQLAMSTNEWVRFVGETGRRRAEPTQIVLGTESLHDNLARREAEEAKLTAWIEAAEVPFIELYYEDLLDSTGMSLSRATRQSLEKLLHLQLDPHIAPQTEKIAPRLRDLIANFDDVARCLQGTPYGLFLEE